MSSTSGIQMEANFTLSRVVYIAQTLNLIGVWLSFILHTTSSSCTVCRSNKTSFPWSFNSHQSLSASAGTYILSRTSESVGPCPSSFLTPGLGLLHRHRQSCTCHHSSAQMAPAGGSDTSTPITSLPTKLLNPSNTPHHNPPSPQIHCNPLPDAPQTLSSHAPTCYEKVLAGRLVSFGAGPLVCQCT